MWLVLKATWRGRYMGPLTSAQPKQQRDGDVMLAASLAAEQQAAAKRAGDDPFTDLGVDFVEARSLCSTTAPPAQCVCLNTLLRSRNLAYLLMIYQQGDGLDVFKERRCRRRDEYLAYVMQVNQKELTYVPPAQKEAQAGVRAALGPAYEQKLRAEADKVLPSKISKRKHQINSLYHAAKMKVRGGGRAHVWVTS